MPASASPLANRNIVITGGFGALGQAVMSTALAASARVVLIDRGTMPATLDPAVLAIPDTDLATFGSAQRAFAIIAERFGTIDGLLNVAGAFEWCPVAHSDTDLWLRLYSANVLTAVNACRAALPLLCPRSAIVNVAAAAAQRGSSGMAAYTAAKSGVLRLTESLAEELEPSSIRVYAVSPTIIDTQRNRQDMPGVDFTTWIKPGALAQTMLHLVSGKSGALNGTEVVVGASGHSEAPDLVFQPVNSVAELDRSLDAATGPVLLDFYDDWCVDCKRMERSTFSDPAVAERLRKFTLLKVDVTAYNDEHAALLRRFGLIGSPAYLFFNEREELSKYRLIGFSPPERFAELLNRIGAAR